MRNKFSLLCAMSIASIVQEGTNVWDGPQTDRNSPKRQPIKVTPPEPKGMKNWYALGYYAKAITAKSAAKKIHKQITRDTPDTTVTVSMLLNLVHIRN